MYKKLKLQKILLLKCPKINREYLRLSENYYHANLDTVKAREAGNTLKILEIC